MAVNSGRKGSAFERMISKELSLWITEGIRNDVFWRTHASGQLGTVSKKKNEYGDVMHIDDFGKPLTETFSIECRHGKCIKVRDLIYNDSKTSSMLQFITEGIENAKLSGRRPLWIFREQGKLIMVMMELEDFHKFVDNSVCHVIIRGFALLPFSEWKKLCSPKKLKPS